MSFATNDRLGSIAPGHSYPLAVFQRITGLSVFAMRRARRNGLKIRTVGRRKFVHADDWHQFLQSPGTEACVVIEPEGARS
ncbi:MAG TPA: hypothetical protein VGJ26_03870 [Pirellulales bacterium]|jgi:hypothetical protein